MGMVAAAAAIAGPAAHPRENDAGASWTWKAANPQAGRLRLSFVRGHVRILRLSGPIRIEVRRRALRGHPGDAEILVTEEADSITITDRYPARPAWWWDESLPPMDERGDFWRTVVILEAVVTAPASAHVQVDLMDGEVEGADRCTVNSRPRCGAENTRPRTGPGS